MSLCGRLGPVFPSSAVQTGRYPGTRMSVDPVYKVARSGARVEETRWKDRTVIDGILGIDVCKNTLDVSISSYTKVGNAVLRAALYMPALSAMRYNSAIVALATTRHGTVLFDHLVGGGEQPGGNLEFEGSCGLDIDDQLELGRPVDRQVRRLRAFEDATGI